MADEWDALNLELTKLAAGIGLDDRALDATPCVHEFGGLDGVAIHLDWTAVGAVDAIRNAIRAARSVEELEEVVPRSGLPRNCRS